MDRRRPAGCRGGAPAAPGGGGGVCHDARGSFLASARAAGTPPDQPPGRRRSLLHGGNAFRNDSCCAGTAMKEVGVRFLVLVLAAALVAVSGCTTGAGGDGLVDRDWTLVWAEGVDAMPGNVATPTIRFGSDGRLAGNTGCNSAGAAYTVTGDRLDIGMVISTKRACIEPQGEALEGPYLSALEGTRRYRIAEGRLELLGEDGTVLARFR
jgi:heat shock protein HslJ